MTIPLGALATIAQNLLFGVTGLSALTDVAVEDPVVGAFAAVLFGAFSTLIAATLVYAACAEALDRIDDGEQPDALDAYRGILPALVPLAWATLRITVVTGLLVVTVIGIPFAVVYLIRKTLTLQSIVIEERGGTSGLKRSSQLVRGSELRVFAIGALINGTVALIGPMIGVVMMFVTPASLGLINLVSALVYVFVLPAAGIAIALLFYDLRIRREGVLESPEPARLEPDARTPRARRARPRRRRAPSRQVTSTDRPPGTPPPSVRDRARSARRGGGDNARKAGDALAEAVGALADQAIDRILLTGRRVTSAAEGKRLLAGEADIEARTDKIQRVVVLAVPAVRVLARGARFTRVPWVMVASSAVSIGVAVRTGVHELQVVASLVAHRLEQATGAPADPALVKKLAIDLYLNPKRTPELGDDRLRLGRLTRKWVLSGALSRNTSKQALRALAAAERLDAAALATRWVSARRS